LKTAASPTGSAEFETRDRWSLPASAILSGLLFAFAFPPLEWVVLLPLAPVPWLLALQAEPSRGRALFSGFVFGLAYWCASIPWIVYVVTTFGGQGSFMGIVCLVLLAAILAEWPAFVAWGVVAAAPARSPWRLALFPLLWTASEHARAVVYGGFPWNLTGFALYRHPVWIQTASLFGAYAVTALAMGVAALLAATVATRRWKPFAAACLLALAAGAFGAWRLGQRPDPGAARRVVALLQPGIPQEARLDPERAAENYRAVVEQARAAASGPPVGLIAIPESSLPTTWDASPTLRRDLVEIAATCGCPVLFNDIETEPSGRYYNAGRLVDETGLVQGSYRKVHLVPFGEYVPLPRIFFFVRKVSAAIGEFWPAEGPRLLVSRELRLGLTICYEVTYESLPREETALGANLLATISNDSWYGKAGAQQQHFAAAVLRAAENGRAMVRAAITGITGAADERGRILGELPADDAGTLRVDVRLAAEKTVWTSWGHFAPFAADAAALGVLVFAVARWWRQRSS